MDHSNSEHKNSKIVKILSWALIIGSAIMLLKLIFVHDGYSGILKNYFSTKSFNPPIDYDYSTFLFFAIVEVSLCIVIFIAASFILKFRDLWRNILIYSLVLSIVVLFTSPKIVVIPYLWSIMFSIFFIAVILKLSSKEIKELFM